MTEYRIEPGALRICDMPAQILPREEMDRVGPENLSDASLLAILLKSGTPGMNVIELATRILSKYETLTGLAAASVDELCHKHKRKPRTADEHAANFRGLGRVKAQVLMAAMEIGRRLQATPLPSRITIRSPADVVRLLRDRIRDLDREVFWVLHLDTKNHLQGEPHIVSQGILDASLVHPREVFRQAIRTATAAVVLAHNHPSGEPTPSAEDLRITRQLVQAGGIVDIRVMDHIVIGRPMKSEGPDYVSMREAGLLEFAEK